MSQEQQKQTLRARTLGFAAVVTAAAICISTVAVAQSPLTPSSITEFVDSEEQVSGGSTVGAVFFSSGDNIVPEALWAYFRDPTAGDLTLTVSSIDGRYSGEIGYKLDSPVTGWVQLGFPTKHSTFVKQYSIDEFAGLLTSVDAEEFYPLRWGSAANTDQVRIYVNSERARTFYYREENGGRKITYCDSPSNSSGFKFNSICDVPVTQITSSDSFKIHRKFGIRTVDPINVNLLMPATSGAASGGE
ncbi:MAG: hypothetical protein ACR2QV_03470 [Gammaproteobacteria bacterium]